jgi:outer membrane protein assembly factor BamB
MKRVHACLFVLLSGSIVAAADWPGWLGPKRDNSSTETIAPWKGEVKVAWRRPVGEGHSSPVVAGGKVFLHTKVTGKDAEEVTAYDAGTGNPVWSTAYDRGPFKPIFGAGPRGTPSVVDGKVYSYGATGFLTCFDAVDGKQRWQIKALMDFKADNLKFGVSTSPLVEEDELLVEVGAKGASVVAFDKNSGKVLWKALDDKASYSSPIVFGKGKERQVVFLTQAGVRSLNPSNGELFWEFPLVDRLNESSTTPVRVGDDLLLVSSVTFGSVGLKLGTKDGKPTAEQLWKNPALSCYFSTPVAVDGYLYMVTGGLLSQKSDLHCVDPKTGKILWTKPKVGKFHAAMLRTGDNKLLMLDDFGNLTFLEPNPKEYKDLAQSKVCGPTWAHPALADGKVYIRDEKELICIDLSGK